MVALGSSQISRVPARLSVETHMVLHQRRWLWGEIEMFRVGPVRWVRVEKSGPQDQVIELGQSAPISLAMTILWTSEVPSPISSNF